MKTVLLRSEEEFSEKYGKFIFDQVNAHYSIIREAVKFLIKMKNQYEEEHVSTSIFLPSHPDEDDPSLVYLNVEVDRKLTFWLHYNEEEPMILDIEGFPCWGQQDEEMLKDRHEKWKQEHEKNQDASRSRSSIQVPSISRLEP